MSQHVVAVVMIAAAVAAAAANLQALVDESVKRFENRLWYLYRVNESIYGTAEVFLYF